MRIDGSEVEFRFRGKSGVHHAVKLHDRRLARIIRQTRDLPGQDLLQYIDDDGLPHAIGSQDVNDYLRAISGADYTAKDFRTWSGTVLESMRASARQELQHELHSLEPEEAAVLALLPRRLAAASAA